MATSKAAVTRYERKAYDKTELRTKKGDRERLKDAAAAAGVSVNAYTIQALNARLIADGREPLQELGEPIRRKETGGAEQSGGNAEQSGDGLPKEA